MICRIAIAILFLAFANPALAQVAPACGQFTPMIDVAPPYNNSPFRYVHFFAKVCNQIMIDGALETIPSGIGVMSGGVVGDVLSACINKTCSQQLAANTLYRVYVFMNGTTMTMDFSTGGHEEDPTYGNQVHASDPERSLVGMIYTNANGLIDGNAGQQMTLSWFNRGHTGLVSFIGVPNSPYYARTCSSTLALPDAVDSSGNVISGYQFIIEFLTFGINDTFSQAFTLPNIEVSGTVQQSVDDGTVHAAIGIMHAGTGGQWAVASHLGGTTIRKVGGSGADNVHTVAIGAAGAEEGRVRAALMMSNGALGGCVSMPSGSLYTQLES